MNSLFKPAAFIALLCGIAVAQNTSPSSTDPAMPQTQAPSTPQTQQTQGPGTQSANGPQKTRIAPGSVIPVQLTKTVDAKKAKTGDEVVAKVTMDMKTQSGDVLVAKDTKVIGHVTEAQARNKEQKESQLGIAFDRTVSKDGNNMQLPMSIQAVIGQQNPNDQSNTPAGGGPAAAPPSGAPAGAAGGGGRSSGGSGSGGTGASSMPPPSPSTAGAGGAEAEGANAGRPPITAQTQGVIGISNLTLSPPSNGAQGSVMTSEKNNVKLESGTMLLLKVNQ